MSISKQFKTVSRRFVATIIGLSVVSVAFLTFVLYQTNTITFNRDVSADKLYSVVESNQAVAEYLEQEKASEAHFITIANLLKQDQQQTLGRALLLATVPVIIFVAFLGYLVAKYLLQPVRESYESQERFMQDAAHELRNPLAAMSLAIENARSAPKTDIQDFVKTIERQTNRLININEDLLYLERRHAGQKIEMLNLSELLYDVLEDLQPAIKHKKLKLTTKIQDQVQYKISQQDFIMLARNIIENAIKYSKKGQTLKVSLAGDKKVIFKVEDQGIGIPKSELNSIGERFYRAKNVAKIDGTGLGMAIVNKILRVYGGNIAIDSAVNNGTKVTIRI